MDAKLTTNDDIDLSTGDIVLLEGVEAIEQHLLIRLRFFLGEWMLNRTLGIPYFEEILKKAPDPNLVKSIFRETILATPGVLRINSFSATLEAETRKLTIDFEALTEEGPLNFNEEFPIL